MLVPGMLVNPILFLALVLLIGYFVLPRNVPAVFRAWEAAVFTIIMWRLEDFMALDEGTFGCLLDDTPYMVDIG
jgi:hypothetical protein